MIKFYFIIFLFLASCSINKNKNYKIECYVSSETNEIEIYMFNKNNFVEFQAIDLTNYNREYCWFIFEFSDIKNDMVKISNIKILPSCKEENEKLNKYKGMWIKVGDYLKVDVPEYDFSEGYVLKIYEKPRLSSDFTVIKESLDFSVLEFENKWVKVKFLNNGKISSGWLRPEDQCVTPWTSCIGNE